MTQTNYSAGVVELKSFPVYGRRIATNYERAAIDCPSLWEAFAQEVDLGKAVIKNGPGKSYGLSIMTGPDSFDYVVAVEQLEGAELPVDLEEHIISGGQYLECECPALPELGAVYGFIYKSAWVAANTDFAVSFSQPCFETYGDDYSENGSLKIYAPLTTKSCPSTSGKN